MRIRDFAWVALIAAGMTLCTVAVFLPQEKPVTKTVYVDHPKGLHRIAALSETVEITEELTKTCEVWANFDPMVVEAFAAGQRYVSSCEITKTGPKG